MKGIYLAAYRAYHPNHDIVYQDINGERDIDGDMMDVDLTPYDYIIATPPCNYWSRANWRRDSSYYALITAHLLPCILYKLIALDKPFIVENVLNSKKFKAIGLFDLPCHVYFIGGHTYWTNILLFQDVKQYDQNKQYISRSARQGGINVHNVIQQFIDQVDYD